MSVRRLIAALSVLSTALILAPAAGAATPGISAAEAEITAEQQAESQVASVSVTQEEKATDRLSGVQPLYRVTMHGHFVYNGVGIPKGFKAPEGEMMEVTVNQETGF